MGANRTIFLGGIPVVLILVFFAYSLVTLAREERDEQAWVTRSYEVMGSLRAILADALDSETGQRGYLLTRSPAFLTPFHDAEARLDRDLDTFQSLTRGEPEQQKRAAQLRKLFADRFKVLNEGIIMSPFARELPPPLLESLEQGRALMNTTRNVIEAGMKQEHSVLNARIEARRALERGEILAAVLVTIILLFILLAAAILLVLNNIRLAVSEAARARQARILQATLDNIREGILVFDRDANVVASNEAFHKLMDYSPSLAATGTALEAFNGVDRESGRETLESLPESGLGSHDYMRFLRQGREIDVYRVSVREEGFLVAATDVTDRVRAEQSLRNAQKMESIGQLTGGMAHDFNNLLQIISANLDLLMKGGGDPSRHAARLQAAIAAVERGARLTGQLLAFARRQPLDPRSINLGRVIAEMTDLLRRTLGEQIEVESIVAGGLWNTLVDRSQVENALLNLAINARDAMPEGGKLTLEVANAFLDETYAATHVEVEPGQYVMIAVTDTGHGMQQEVVAKAFDPFFTTKPDGQGTGLGLSQVYGFVKQSGGHVQIYSEIGEGTTVKLYLPRSHRSHEALEAHDTRPAIGGSETVLVVEDDDGVRAAIADLLNELGYSVLCASNAEEALMVLRSGAQIDLLFTDVVMPGNISTREFARRARDFCPGLRVLFTSGYTQNAIVHNGKLDNDVFLLSKPYRKDDLARRLRGLLDRVPPAGSVRKLVPTDDTNTFLPAPVTAVESANASKSEPLLHDKLKVLVVEDVALVRMTTVDMIESLGHEALEAADGTQALKLVETNPEIDVMVADLGLPGMSGAEMISEVRKIRPDLRIVIASGYPGESAEKAALPRDVSFLNKPYNDAQLKRAFDEGSG